MTVSELIGELMQYPSDADVVRPGALGGPIEVASVTYDPEVNTVEID